MTNKKRSLIALTFVIVLLTSATLFYWFSKQKTQIKEVNVNPEYREVTEKIFEQVLSKIEAVRGLSLNKKVGLKIVDVNWVKKNWGKEFIESASRDLFIEQKIYEALFLINESVNLKKIMYDEYSLFTAAAWQGDIYVVKENFNPYKKIDAEKVLAHEMTHILQGVHFMKPKTETYDSKQAWSALIEGDAMLAGDKFVEEEIFNKSRVSAKTTVKVFNNPFFNPFNYEVIPEPLIKLWLFPYHYGEDFVLYLYKKGGWKEVNNAYLNPPQTTEQIIHIKKYLKNESFLKVPSVKINGSGWEEARNDRLGEHFIYVTLSTWTTEKEAEKASYGWGGDNFTLYLNKRGDYFFTWLIRWDNLNDSEEFYQCLTKALRDGIKAKKLLNGIWGEEGKYIWFKEYKDKVLIAGSSNFEQLKNFTEIN